MYTVFKINLDGNLSSKEHLNNFDEVNTWLYEVAYYQYANVKIINDEGANNYDMLKFTNVIITSTSMKKIEIRLLDEKN